MNHTESTRPALAVRGLSAGYPKAGGPNAAAVLNAINLTVLKGELLAVLGPSGCGKTTLLRVLAGLLPAEQGQVEIDGQLMVDDGHGLPPERRRIGLVPQDAALFPHRTVAANVDFGLRRPGRNQLKLGRTARGERIAEMLNLVGLAEFAARYPHELSGGQRQRVALARALAPRPSLVLLDEPFGALDAALRASLKAEVGQILRSSGATAILVTHDQDEALSMADRVALLHGGKIVQIDTPEQMYSSPHNEWAAGFLGECTVLDGHSDGETVEFALGRFTARTAPGPVRVMLRPEQLVLADPQAPGVAGTVERVEYRGHSTMYRIKITSTGSDILAKVSGQPDYSREDQISIRAEKTFHLFPG